MLLRLHELPSTGEAWCLKQETFLLSLARTRGTLALLIVLAFLSFPLVHGQSTYGSVAGSVTDSSGAVIADAQVTLTNLGTSEKRIQLTGNGGLYSFVTVNPGQYRVEAEKEGFKHIAREPLVAQVQQNTRIDIVMQAGMITEVANVTAETPLLQSESSSLGQVIEQREANELPLNGRNIFNLAALSPAVVPQGQSNDTPVGKNIFAWANYQIGGSFANQGAEYLDGQPLNIAYINLPIIVPTQDSIQEFKVETNALGQEWGKCSGGVINLSTKSGTNQTHGEVHEYLRNKLFNANEYFLKASQILAGVKNDPPPFTQNQFGASAGGALIKNKTFWFFSWESFRLRQGQVYTTNVPTAAERNGDFTGLADQAGNSITIYDPASTDPITGVRQEFPTHNVIPLGQQDPTARALLNLFPSPPAQVSTTITLSPPVWVGIKTNLLPASTRTLPRSNVCFFVSVIGICSIWLMTLLGLAYALEAVPKQCTPRRVLSTTT
jgi:hypothetical protein